MKNENVHMQALHRKLYAVLVRILPYNCSETYYSFCKDSPPPQQDSALNPEVGFTLRPLQPPLFFRSAAPDSSQQVCGLQGSDASLSAMTNIPTQHCEG